jgi:hypothetical protein
VFDYPGRLICTDESHNRVSGIDVEDRAIYVGLDRRPLAFMAARP